VGSGSGVDGTWTANGYSYVVISGTLTVSEKAEFDEMVKDFNTYTAFTTNQVIFSNGILYTKSDTKTAEQFIAEWNGLHSDIPAQADSARFNISLRVLDKHTVELKGNSVAETVILLINNDDSRVYTSSNPEHAKFTHANPPVACPNDLEPDWYTEFLFGNAKGGGIIRKSSSVPHNTPKTGAFFSPF
jgi:G3E family GTPase